MRNRKTQTISRQYSKNPRAQWAALAVAALWLLAVLALTGCATERLPDYATHALRVTVTESARDLEARRCAEVRDGYRRTLAVLCAVLDRSAVEGRGAWEWLVGLAGIVEHQDLEVPEVCR